MKKLPIITGILCALLFLLCACAPVQEPSPQPSAAVSQAVKIDAPSVSPSPGPPPELDEILAGYRFSDACTPPALYAADGEAAAYELPLNQPEITQSLLDCYDAWEAELVKLVQQVYGD